MKCQAASYLQLVSPCLCPWHLLCTGFRASHAVSDSSDNTSLRVLAEVETGPGDLVWWNNSGGHSGSVGGQLWPCHLSISGTHCAGSPCYLINRMRKRTCFSLKVWEEAGSHVGKLSTGCPPSWQEKFSLLWVHQAPH
jgi:hypothetical protein